MKALGTFYQKNFIGREGWMDERKDRELISLLEDVGQVEEP